MADPKAPSLVKELYKTTVDAVKDNDNDSPPPEENKKDSGPNNAEKKPVSPQEANAQTTQKKQTLTNEAPTGTTNSEIASNPTSKGVDSRKEDNSGNSQSGKSGDNGKGGKNKKLDVNCEGNSDSKGKGNNTQEKNTNRKSSSGERKNSKAPDSTHKIAKDKNGNDLIIPRRKFRSCDLKDVFLPNPRSRRRQYLNYRPEALRCDLCFRADEDTYYCMYCDKKMCFKCNEAHEFENRDHETIFNFFYEKFFQTPAISKIFLDKEYRSQCKKRFCCDTDIELKRFLVYDLNHERLSRLTMNSNVSIAETTYFRMLILASLSLQIPDDCVTNQLYPEIMTDPDVKKLPIVFKYYEKRIGKNIMMTLELEPTIFLVRMNDEIENIKAHFAFQTQNMKMDTPLDLESVICKSCKQRHNYLKITDGKNHNMSLMDHYEDVDGNLIQKDKNEVSDSLNDEKFMPITNIYKQKFANISLHVSFDAIRSYHKSVRRLTIELFQVIFSQIFFPFIILERGNIYEGCVAFMWFIILGSIGFDIFPITFYILMLLLFCGYIFIPNKWELVRQSISERIMNATFLLIIAIAALPALKMHIQYDNLELTLLYIVMGYSYSMFIVCGILLISLYHKTYDIARLFRLGHKSHKEEMKLSVYDFYDSFSIRSTYTLHNQIFDTKVEVELYLQKFLVLEVINLVSAFYAVGLFLLKNYIYIEGLSNYLDSGSSFFVSNNMNYSLACFFFSSLSLLLFFSKMIASYFVNSENDKTIAEIKHMEQVLKWIILDPSYLFNDRDLLVNDMETKYPASAVIFSGQKINDKIKFEFKNLTLVVLNTYRKLVIKRKIQEATPKELIDLIATESEIFLQRTKFVKKVFIDFNEAISYRFLGLIKVDKDLLLKLGTVIVSTLGTVALAYLQTWISYYSSGNEPTPTPAPQPSNVSYDASTMLYS